MRLIFMGTADFAVATLQALAQSAHEICAVYTRPPTPKGRGLKHSLSPVHACAQELGLPIFTPSHLRDKATQEAFIAQQADLAIVAAYGLLLPAPVLAAPKQGCWNIHASLLPRWRGAAPIQRAIMAGDKKTGICLMQMDEGLDTGALLLRKEIKIDKTATAGSLHNALAALGAETVIEGLAHIEANKPLIAEPQAQTGINYAAKISKAETRIDWTRPAHVLDAHIRGLSPTPGAWFEVDNMRVKVLQAEIVESAEKEAGQAGGAGVAGQLLDTTPPLIACGRGALRLLQVQKAGKAVMGGATFQRGARLKIGQKVK
ncbi:MAG: methionyl-tRNA formyltransferase [Alphaproteobacteria bacterium]|nr:methionyl-tRNA formyltransferase [Alphaproteobacteria bacterium]